ncbi:O-mannosyltransferase Ogm1 [Schizosaccharomyces cryophilus OY26]|uniref:Dolichyl-phosphate-mannose--protein mannosyltransferase n=1 Tax=Schizosaccharomyces cryophilus (strain OY26 / ATCC MYA-4695 / CBS 11777 / NBRC 106824 / NRRL Y48691) TaxID=653667 RepID=S9XAT5_SCHCR|nr:O-mannosyltransferase Ogm1 [Schizosaccharomyces cryophilus OY26]EPY50841.1 O-mannosyltransferase Ogm1 [Schizosaccharomyces cryophilus OY26]
MGKSTPSALQSEKQKRNIRDVELSRPRKFFTSRDFGIVLLLSVVAFAVRVQRLMNPSKVVFEELRYVNYAVDYASNKFVMDVYPPLGKLLLSFGLTFMNSNPDLTKVSHPGQEFPSFETARSLRLIIAAFGSLLIPLMYGNVYLSSNSKMAAFMASVFAIFDNGLITMSRYVMIEIPTLFFMGLTSFFWMYYENQQKYPFALKWHISLLYTGISLGLTISTKLSGLFTLFWILVLALFHLWNLIGDLTVPITRIIRYGFNYTFYLIGVPMVVYLGIFAVHSKLAYKSNIYDSFLTPEYKYSLEGNDFGEEYADVAYGSLVTIRNAIPEHGYLHSNELVYPEGTKQQIISLVDHPNQNTLWIIEHENAADNDRKKIELLKDGSIVRLRHIMTGRALHSHDHRPLVSNHDWQLEVSGYGGFGFEGDGNDLFRIQILDRPSRHASSNGTVEAFNTYFRLIHVFTNCELMTSHRRLPDWGQDHREVTCCRNCIERSTTWVIESNFHDAMPSDARKTNYRKPSFFEKFIEANKLMWLKDRKMGDGHEFESHALTWPFLLGPLRFMSDQNLQVYFMGNPVVWYSVVSLIVFFALVMLFFAARWNMGYNDCGPKFYHHSYNIGKFALAWFIHWAPYILETDRVFLYHYLPALYFGIMALGVGWAFVGNVIFEHRPAFSFVTAAFITLMFGVYYLYSPFTFMTPLTQSSCQSLELKGSWNFRCNSYMESLSQYNSGIVNPIFYEEAAPHPFVYNGPAENSHSDVPLKENLAVYYPAWDAQVEMGYKIAAEEKAAMEAKEAASAEAASMSSDETSRSEPSD